MPAQKTAARKYEIFPENWYALPLEKKYDFVNEKLHRLADIDCDFGLDILLHSCGNGETYRAYVEWTDAGCIWDETDTKRRCQFVRKKPAAIGDVSPEDFPPDVREELKTEDWKGEYDLDMPNIIDSSVDGGDWSECLRRLNLRIELLKLGYEICWDCEEYREDHREFFKEHFENLGDAPFDDNGEDEE